jgi:hypothetical protein
MPSAKILGFQFDLATPYAVGHICTYAEAEALNKLLVRGLAKGLHKVIDSQLAGFDKVLDPDQRAAITESGLEYIEEFTLGFSAGHDIARAIRLECSRLARQMLEVQLNREGRVLKDLTPGEVHSALSDLMKSERIVAEATRRVSVTQEIAQRAEAELHEALGDLS